VTHCNRCGLEVTDPEVCWWCYAPLCAECWDEYGHCGHPEADAENERARERREEAGQ
jgi:hypothetical protein